MHICFSLLRFSLIYILFTGKEPAKMFLIPGGLAVVNKHVSGFHRRLSEINEVQFLGLLQHSGLGAYES